LIFLIFYEISIGLRDLESAGSPPDKSGTGRITCFYCSGTQRNPSCYR
jgi:hypothetical protein